jgi:hypothetical protein
MLVRVQLSQNSNRRYTYYSPVAVQSGDYVVVLMPNGSMKTVKVTSVIRTNATTKYKGQEIKPIFGTVKAI